MDLKNLIGYRSDWSYSIYLHWKVIYIAHSYSVKVIATDVVESKGFHGWKSFKTFMKVYHSMLTQNILSLIQRFMSYGLPNISGICEGGVAVCLFYPDTIP